MPTSSSSGARTRLLAALAIGGLALASVFAAGLQSTSALFTSSSTATGTYGTRAACAGPASSYVPGRIDHFGPAIHLTFDGDGATSPLECDTGARAFSADASATQPVSLTSPGSYTVVVVVGPVSSGGDLASLSGPDGGLVARATGGAVTVYSWLPGEAEEALASVALTGGGVHVVAFTLDDDGDIRLWADGNSDSAGGYLLPAGAGEFAVGAHPAFDDGPLGASLTAVVAEAALYTSVLSDAQLESIAIADTW